MLAVQSTPTPAGVSMSLADAADESSSSSSTSSDTRKAAADSSPTFNDGPRPGDKENPFRDESLNNTALPARAGVSVADSVSSRLAKSQSVIESLQRSLVTKLSPVTIETLKSKYASTPAPLARPEADLDVPDATKTPVPRVPSSSGAKALLTSDKRVNPSPLLPAKSGAEANPGRPIRKPQANGKPAAAFDVSNVESQSSVKLAFLSGDAARQQQPVRTARPANRKAVERRPLHFLKAVPVSKPPVPAKKDELRSIYAKPRVVAVPKKKSPVKQSGVQDGLSELLKNLVAESSTTSPAEKSRGGDRSFAATSSAEATTASSRPPKPQPAPRTTSLPQFQSSPTATGSPTRLSREATSTPISSPRPLSLSPVQRPSPATSPGRTPPERSRLLEDKLNEIRKDLWEEEQEEEARRNDAASKSATVPPQSVQEATLEHYARAIQRHLDGSAPPPRLSELRVDTSSSAHSSTSTLVSTPSQSPGWASSGESRSLPPAPRGRRLTEGSPPPSEKKRLRDELLSFYYRSLEREARRPPAPGRSGRLSAPPVSYTTVIPTDNATYTPDRTLRQEFIVVRDRSPEVTYQNVQLLRPPPGSPLLASGEESDSTIHDNPQPPRHNMNFFVRGGPQRNTIGSYPARRTPPRDEVDLRREFGGDVELRHPEKLSMLNNKKRHNSESETTPTIPTPVNGKAKNGKPGVFEGWGPGKDGKVKSKSNGKKSLFPIFRRGSLHPSPPTTPTTPGSPGTPPPTLPKRVSFSSASSPMYAASPPNADGWPTRNGPAATPPTRVSRLDSSDSVFLPNWPAYASDTEEYTRRYRHQENIYANQYAVAPGEGTYVNYTMPTPPEVNGVAVTRIANGVVNGVYGVTQQQANQQPQLYVRTTQPDPYGSTRKPPTGVVYGTAPGVHGCTSPAGVYGSTNPTGMYGSTQQTAAQVYSPAQQTPSGVYGSNQKPPSGVYGSAAKSTTAGVYGSAAKSPTAGVYGSAAKSPSAGVYGTRQQPSPGPYRTLGPSPYGSNTTPNGSSAYSPYGTRAAPNGPNGVAYSPSQPPSGPAGSSPGSASVGSAPSPAGTSFNASFASNTSSASFNASNISRFSLPPRAQSATPTMMAMMSAPDRPLPPVPVKHSQLSQLTLSESESGSEAGEVQRILQQANDKRKITYCKLQEEEWGVGGKGRGPGDLGGPPGGSVRGDEEMRRGGGRGGRGGRDDPRRHTLGGDQHPLPPQGGTLSRSMDLEMSAKQRKKSPMARGYPPPSNAMLFDDDPGIMSEVETSSTGFHRGGKQRSSLPVVRTPSKTLERPLGLVFLQYRNETKRALLPNEITSLDTVKALFVRSFSKQLTMEYLDSPHVKIYIHDSNKDMFYELEDHRSHLRDIHDRSVLRLFEATDLHSGVFPGAGTGLVPPTMWETDQSYFSEPEFDSEYQHQHIHKSKASKSSGVPPQPYYMTHSFPPGSGPPGAPGSSATLPRGGSLMRAYSPAPKSLPPSALPVKSIMPPPPLRSYVPPTSPIPLYPSPTPPPPPRLRPPRPPQRKYLSPYLSPNDPREAASAATSPTPSQDRLHAESGYMSSPERGGSRAYPAAGYPSSASVSYEEGYYGQYGTRSGSITPVIDEEASDTELMDEQYSLYGVKLPGGPGIMGPGLMGPGLHGPRGPPARAPFPTPAGPPYDVTRIRVENMERQLANLTGLVQKALTHGPTHLAVPGAQGYRNASGEFDTHGTCSPAPQDDPTFVRSDVKPPKLGKDKSVSFEKSVSFSDEPPDMNSPKQHSPQHGADTKPTKPAIKSSTLPRTSSQERDRHKPAPPPKPMSLSPGQYEGRNIYRDLQLTPEMYNQLRGLQKKAKDLRQEVRNLRRMSQAQAHSVRETIRDTFIKIRAMLITGAEGSWAAIGDAEKLRLSREEELYKQEMLRLEKDLTELESTVEELRGNVINRKTRVNMSDVENMALILSKSSKTVADLKVRFPGLQDEMKSVLTSEMDKVMREEKFLKEEPERLESALRRCKKLTGTLVTLKRLASVQEQRLPCPPGAVGADARLSPTLDDEPLPPTPSSATSKACLYGSGGDASPKRPENALDALLDELQTFAKPPNSPGVGGTGTATGHPPTMAEIGRRKGSIETANPPPPPSNPSNPTSSLRRLHSYPSSSDGGGNSPPSIARLQVSDSKPPVPERNADLLAKRVPPPPPPRTSSRSPLASPTSPSLPPRTQNPPSQPQMGTQGTLRRAPGRAGVRSSSIPGADPLRNPQPQGNPQGNLAVEEPPAPNAAASNSSSCESVNSQEGAAAKKERQEALEQRHQELLRKQRALQEQYARLQQLQRGTTTVPTPDLLLKKTGSESNLLAKMGMQGLSAAAPMSGSLTHLASASAPLTTAQAQTTTSKIYETDIL